MANVGSGGRLGLVAGLKIDRTRRATKSSRRRILGIAALVGLALAALVVLARRPPLVAVAQVREARPGEDLTELTAAGYVAAERRSTVAPKIPGRLVSVLVKEGQQVTEGDVLVRLEDNDAVAALGQAQAQGLSANGQLG